VDLPFYVYLLPVSGSNAVKWGDWLRISYTFHWTYSSINYAVIYMSKLHVHPADISGASSIAFPYFAADGVCNIKDASLIGANWGRIVPPGTDPTSPLARADIIGGGIVNVKDAAQIGANWGKTWINTPPSG